MPRTYYFRSRFGTLYTTNDPDGAPFNGAWGDPPTRLSKAEFTEERIAHLKDGWINPGDTLYTNVTQVARSGMSRHIQVFRIKDNEPHNISMWVAEALEWRYIRDDNSIFVGGCGMDMGFHVVYSLSCVLFGDGYTLQQKWL